MKKRIADGKEIGYLLLLLLLLVVALKILFFNETLVIIVKTALTLFWLFILPGYVAMNHWREKLGFAERVVMGSCFSAAIIGIVSYYLGLFGLSLRYHGIIVPLLIIALSLLVQIKPNQKQQGKGCNSRP